MIQPYYQDYDSTLYHGNSMELLRTLDVKPDLILTSPPYDDRREYGGYVFDFDAMADTLVAIMPEGGVIVWVIADATVDGSETGTSFQHALGFKERGLKLYDTMIYEKDSVPPLKSHNVRYKGSFEYMFVLSKGRPKTTNIIADVPLKNAGEVKKVGSLRQRDGSLRDFKQGITPTHGRRSNIWRYSVGFLQSAPDNSVAYRHPAIFPLELASDHIRSWTNPGDLVLDPMAGSGTTLRAAKDLGRRSIGVEINEAYCKNIIPRLGRQVFDIF